MNKHKKTFVILVPGFPENEADSACLPLQQSIVKNIKDAYPALSPIVLSFQYPYFKKKYDWLDIPVISFDGRNKGGLTRLLTRRSIFAALKEIHRSSEIVGLLSFWYGECAYVGKRFADKYGLRHYCWLMGQDAKKKNKYPGILHLKSNELIALSDFLQEEFEKNHGTKPAHVIPPGVDSNQFPSMQPVKDIDILAAGSLIPLKQYSIFIDIVSAIKKQMPGIKGVLVGDGPEKSKLQELITKHDLQSTITLTGELSHPEVLKMMQRAKLFLHTSSYEGFGMVCIEALYAGCEVISFNRVMKEDIERWHIVEDKEEMHRKVYQLLNTLNEPVKALPFTISQSVDKVIRLFQA